MCMDVCPVIIYLISLFMYLYIPVSIIIAIKRGQFAHEIYIHLMYFWVLTYVIY